MKSINAVLILLLATAAAAAPQGTVPLKAVSEYSNHVEADGVGLGALILNDAQMKQRFVTNFDQDYMVVEVALYPKAGSELTVQPEQFFLNIAGEKRTLRSENPKVIASTQQKGSESKRDITVVPHVGVGYESGTRTYDPTTGGTRRTSGVYTSTGVSVMVGGSTPNANPKNEEVMAIELSEKGLPGGAFTKPVAGHLYFRIGKETAKNLNAGFELACEIDGKEVVLPLKR